MINAVRREINFPGTLSMILALISRLLFIIIKHDTTWNFFHIFVGEHTSNISWGKLMNQTNLNIGEST